MTFGLPYQGSKNKLARWIINALPSADNFYDVFAGGCAVSHAALLSNKFKHIFASDINDSVLLFEQAIKGELAGRETEWISREDFMARKDTDPYVRVLWSFGNDQQTYLYSRDVEPLKHAMHNLIYAPTPNERRLLLKPLYEAVMERIQSKCNLTSGQNERLQSSERANRVPQFSGRPMCELENKQRSDRIIGIKGSGNGTTLECAICSYNSLTILPNSVIYADPPYRGAKEYLSASFDYDTFYDWCLKQEQLVVISEYNMPDEFVSIASKERVSTLSATNNSLRCMEKLFIPAHQLELYNTSLCNK